MSLRELVEATLHGRDERLVAKCNVPAILQVLERWDIFEAETLASTMATSFAELQADMEQVAARSFLGLLKFTLGKATCPQPPETPSSAPPTTPFTEAPPFHQPPFYPPPMVPIVITIKCKKCKAGGELLACSFCTAVYHNTDACLGEAKLGESLAKSASFPWACPACWKKAAVSIQKVALKPTAQPAAGKKKRRKRS